MYVLAGSTVSDLCQGLRVPNEMPRTRVPQARAEPPLLSRHRIQLKYWGGAISATETLLLRVASLESVLTSQHPMLRSALLKDVLSASPRDNSQAPPSFNSYKLYFVPPPSCPLLAEHIALRATAACDLALAGDLAQLRSKVQCMLTCASAPCKSHTRRDVLASGRMGSEQYGQAPKGGFDSLKLATVQSAASIAEPCK